MVIVNEFLRPTIKEKPYLKYGITAINSADKITEKCSWRCHNNTFYCKKNHVKYLKNYYAYTDPIYFGIISLLTKTGNYGLANVVFWVIILPLFIWILIIQSLNIQGKIRKIKKKQSLSDSRLKQKGGN
ncbi:MAG: hypothetical protein CSA05_03000 [Bacteroidia bacterium]|nr:MAG: hypothetical protein CSA05_03000 [Bacteroidia bacterium]